MDIIISGKQGEGKTSKAEALTNGLGRVVSITAFPDEPVDSVVKYLTEVGAKGAIFDGIPDTETLSKAVQTARLYRGLSGVNLMAVYCLQDEAINFIK